MDTFTYTLPGGDGDGRDDGHLRGRRPVAVDDSDGCRGLGGDGARVLSNDTDVDGGPLVTAVTQPATGPWS